MAEKAWNAQLGRRIVCALPREVPKEQYADMVRDYCNEQFVSKGMICDFAIHDKGDGNPHAHILLTMRAMDEDGKWLPKSRKVYDLDENGERIRLPSGRWKSHKENTTDWNNKGNAEIWRKGWADITNKYLEANGRDERLDLRSYKRRGIEAVPTVHMGAAATGLERKGVRTNTGNLNRDIRNANATMRSISQEIRKLWDWITKLELENKKTAKKSELAELLMEYIDVRKEERRDWSGGAKQTGLLKDIKGMSDRVAYLAENGIHSVDGLYERLDSLSSKSSAMRSEIRPLEKRMREIDQLLASFEDIRRYKPVNDEFAGIHWKGRRKKFFDRHKEELDRYHRAERFIKMHAGISGNEAGLREERARLESMLSGLKANLRAVQTETKTLRDVRYMAEKALGKGKSKYPESGAPERAEGKEKSPQRHGAKESVLKKLREKQKMIEERDRQVRTREQEQSERKRRRPPPER